MNNICTGLCLFSFALLPMAPEANGQIISHRAQIASKSRVQPIAFPSVFFVDVSATGAGSGYSWSNAFTNLHPALALARPGDQIWVAAGSYHVSDPGGSQADTYTIPSGVKVYGGFTGTETLLAQRDPVLNQTALSADINRDDVTTGNFDINSLNNWNIVTMNGADANTRLDGFDLQTGHLYGATGTRRYGAGVNLTASSPVIANCSFSFCVATKGGAIYSDTGDATIESCTFTSNWASDYSSNAAAIYNDSGDMVILDSVFSGNRSESRGGSTRGGAIYNGAGNLIIERCRFVGNTALARHAYGSVAYGGAIYLNSGLVRVSDSFFEGNDSNMGGAISTGFFFTPVCEIYNSQFLGNTVQVAQVNVGIENGGDAGAIFGGPTSIVDIVGCQVMGGDADNYGGAFVGGTGFVSSSIFWGNSDSRGSIGKSQIKAHRVYYSCVENMLVGEPGEDPPDPAKFPNSIDLDPLFVATPQGPNRLSAASPCIDAADNTAWPMFINLDMDGNPRFVDDPLTPDTGFGSAPIADMGPFEVQ